MSFLRKNLEKHLRNEKNSRIFAFPIWKSWSSRNENMLGSIAQLVQSVCLTSRGSGVRLPLLPLRKHFGISEVLFSCFVRHGLHPFHRHVRTKTFSTHITFKIHHVVRKSCVFAHERILQGSRIKTSPVPR